jgi:hypothetical protein
VLTWLFPTGVTTHVLLTAGLRNPTVRLRYLAARGAAGAARLRPAEQGRVEQHLAAMTAVFDRAAAVATKPFPFASDITPAAQRSPSTAAAG